MPLISFLANVSVSSVINAASTAAHASSNLAERACLERILNASAIRLPEISLILATKSLLVSGAFQSHNSGLTMLANSLMAAITVCICS